MKTFEERYTAWIDGKLEGPALTSFELELSRRASAGEARADKADAAHLHTLLKTHLQAPAMTNADFFSHQLRDRIDAERASQGRRREESGRTRPWLLWSPLMRFAGLGAACAFVAVALYYGMVPPHAATPTGPRVAMTGSTVPPAPSVASATPGPESLASHSAAREHSDDVLAFVSTPPPVDLNTNIPVAPVPSPAGNTSVTPLPLKDPNANVLWINGLDHLQPIPGESPANAAAPSPAGN